MKLNKIIAGGMLVAGLAGLIGCGPSKEDIYGEPLHRVLKSSKIDAVLSTESEKSKWDGSLVSTNIYITPENGKRRLLLNTRPSIQDIVVNDFNKDGIDDFIIYLDIFSKWDGSKIGSISETYLSTGNDFTYEKAK